MNDDADFPALYKELGIDPECDTDTFKRAYRRRVSGLHPDRGGGNAGDEDALKMLNSACSAALEFHRVHGRFPGTTVKSTATSAGMRNGIAPAGAEDASEPGIRTRRRTLAWLGLGVALIILVLSANDDDRPAAPAMSMEERPAAARADSQEAAEGPVLRLGMSPDEVITVIGRPFSSDATGQQWLYGASWVKVACGQLVDWYSSPLQPLNAAHERPGPGDAIPDFRPRRHCPPNS